MVESDLPDPLIYPYSARLAWRKFVHTSLVAGFRHRESTDHDVIPVRVSEGKLHGPCVRVHAWLFFESSNYCSCSLQSHAEIVHTEEQKQTVARLSVLGVHQWGMLMCTPLMKAEQDRAIRVAKLAEVVMSAARQRLAEE